MAFSQRVEAALVDFQRYLQDDIQPPDGADAVATLMAQPPEVVMQRVAAWCAAVIRVSSASPSELLLHCLRKIYITGELNLLDRAAVANFLDRATALALQICPVELRDGLRQDVATMRMSGTAALWASAAIGKVPTLGGTTPVPPPPPAAAAAPVAPPAPPAVSPDEAQTARRFSLILDRLKREAAVAGPQQASQPEPQALAQLLTMAASRSQTGEQFNEYMKMIRPLSGGGEGNVFVILGGAIPSWDLGAVAPGTSPQPAQVAAIEKIIDLAEDPAAVMQRFRELVTGAVSKFSDGSLGAAVWMLDVAEDTIKEKKLDMYTVDRIRAEAANGISSVQLRKYTENKSKHAALKLVLGFFPTLQLGTLFDQLRGEPRAERRRALLGFIEAYAVAGRDRAFEELERELTRPDLDTYYLRNLIFLLHRIARDPNASTERELKLITQASAPGQNFYIIKEAVVALGQIKTDESVRVLTTRLAEFELLLLRNDVSVAPAAEMQKLLDRIIAALARIGTSSALLTIARHGMKTNPPLGDTRARLAALAQHDLSFDEQTVSVLVKALRDDIPGKLLGRFLPKNQEQTLRLIEALSSTRAEVVEDLFTDVAQRFADQDIGRAAAQIVEKWAPKAPEREPPATLTGELEFFGLPAVMQSLGDMRATGMLTLRTKQGQAAAKIVVTEGKFVTAQRGPIRGAEAFYDIMERPISGSFAFVPYPMERMKTDIEPREMIGILLEGVRRHDELQRILALVPDGTSLVRTNVKPTASEDESDPIFIRDIWTRVSGGKPVGEWEHEVPADSYRVRSLVAFWLEQGALAPAEPSA